MLGLVVEPLADREARSRTARAPRHSRRAGRRSCRRGAAPGRVPRSSPRRSKSAGARGRARSVASSKRPVLRITSASAVSHQASASSSPAASASASASSSTCSARGQLADELEHLAELQQDAGALGLVEQRREPLEVVDRRGVRVRRLRGLAGAPQVRAACCSSSSLCQKWWASRSRFRSIASGSCCLDEAADVAVQRRPERVREALVGDLLRDGVLEEVRLVLLAVGVDEVEQPQRAEVRAHVVERPELRVDARAASARGRRGRRRSRP